VSYLAYREADVELQQPPRRVYARLDHFAPEETDDSAPEEGGVAMLDSVNADWFDEARRDGERKLADTNTAEEAEWRVSVLEVPRRDLEEQVGRVSRGDWLALELGAAGDPLVLNYLNLFAAPVARRLESAARVEPDLDRQLADKTSMDDLADADASDLDAVLAGLPEPDAVAVYDVGQGGCNAALAAGFVRLYFDIGGGVNANRETFPQALQGFCFSQAPPVVLSHWDWDHWSSANRDPRAQAQTWIVPRQGAAKGLGPVHRTFLARLLQRGRVLVWPQGLPSLRVGAYELLACTGRTRNDGGLALALRRTVDGTARRMLLPGDCRYDHVPTAADGQLTSLVAAHHGGRTKSTLIPQPDGCTEGRLVYSYGRYNQDRHPFDSVRNDHTTAHWYPALETAARSPARTTPGGGKTLGHVHLYWDTAAPDAHPACGGSACDLTCHQR
jgi:hypothetical protein